jgi:peptide/nickel transport system substrate-binding protein
VRQAVAAAIDVTQMNTRVWDGKADVSTDLFTSKSRWYTVPGPKYDLDAAKKLVAQVKAEGTWDGSIRVACDNTLPAWSITVKALLEAAGFKVTIQDQQDVATRISLIQVKKEFDVACYGTAIADSEPLYAMNRELNSALIGGAGNPTGYSNPAVDDALKKAYSAKNDTDKKAAIETIAKAYATDVPLLSLDVTTEFITANSNVHGIEPLSMNIVSLAKAWID